MLQTRVIPVLLLKGEGLYKGVKFKNHKYIGDPVNTVKIFNDKEVDELVILDIEASKLSKPINFNLLKDIVSEAFMPIAYGGGIKTVEDAKTLFSLGIEKVILNTYALKDSSLIKELVDIFGSQSVVFSLDVKKGFFGREAVFSTSGTKKVSKSPLDIAKSMQSLGIGEIIINSIDNDGMMKGYNLKLIEEISHNLSIPVVALSGASSLNDFILAKKSGAHAVAAGSMFVYNGVHKAVLISYPSNEKLCDIFEEK